MIFFRLSVCLVYLLFSASASLATPFPDSNTLSRMCANLADRMEDDIRAHTPDVPLHGVCVFLFLPSGETSPLGLDARSQRLRGDLEATFMDALIDRPATYGHVLERGPRWKRFVLAEHKNDLALEEKNMPEIGRGLGAKWVVTGNFWEEDGHLVVRAKIFHAEKAETVAQDMASTRLLDLYRQEAIVTIPLMVGMFLFVPGGVYLRRRKQRTTARADTEHILASRDLDRVRELLAGDAGTLSPEERNAFENLLSPVGSMTFESNGLRYILAPGPEQGIGRGSNWIFSLADPHVSRSGRACVQVVNGIPWLSALRENQPLEDEDGSATSVMIGDGLEIGLSSVSRVKGYSGPGWVRLQVTHGPGEGTVWVMIWGQASVGGGPECAVTIPGLPETCGHIVWTGDRPCWACSPQCPWPWPDILQGENEAVLAHGDRFSLGAIRFQIGMK